MKNFNIQRRFEIPYNFDPILINIFKLLQVSNIYNFYIPPFIQDYESISRKNHQDNYYLLTEQEYNKHIENINISFPSQLSLLLQSTQQIMPESIIKKYQNLGFSNFIVGTIKQAQIIKNVYAEANITGSITMHINKEIIIKQLPILKQLFNNFVLDFSYNKNLDKIKELPQNYFNYILLLNSFCNIYCQGDQHWFKQKDEEFFCPGVYLQNNLNYNESCLIRPMDLFFFDKYISIYKLQDRSWTTENILYDYFLYNSDFSIYPNILYDINLYKKNKTDN